MFFLLISLFIPVNSFFFKELPIHSLRNIISEYSINRNLNGWRSDFQSLDDITLFTNVKLLNYRIDTVEKRREFLEGIVKNNYTVSFPDAMLVFAYSLKNGGPEWCFSALDNVLKGLLSNKYEDNEAGMIRLASDINTSLSIVKSDFDDIATNLMILNIQEAVLDEMYQNYTGSDDEVELTLPFGECYPDSDKYYISSTTDNNRRVAIFKALCVFRFVRQGLDV